MSESEIISELLKQGFFVGQMAEDKIVVLVPYRDVHEYEMEFFKPHVRSLTFHDMPATGRVVAWLYLW